MDDQRTRQLALQATDEHIEDLKRQLEEAKHFKDKVSSGAKLWDLQIDLDAPPTRHGLTGKTGIYVKVHKPTDTSVYVGQGNPMNRRATHKSIFKNNGDTLVYTNEEGKVTSSVDSPAARKMYNFDPDISNWATKIAIMPKPIAAKMEPLVQQELDTEFNDSKMLGKS